jgi:beta-lactamase class A
MTGAAAAMGTMPMTRSVMAEGKGTVSPEAVLSVFKTLPGDVAVKIYAPAANGKPEFLVEQNASKVMFVGSAIKTFILCEALRRADSPTVVQTLKAKQLALDASVWSVDSATFNPPNLIGKVSQRTALEAMILHSDNTGTDMSIKDVGPEKVREFVASIGLKNTMVPDSTRALFAYLLGAKDPRAFSWEDLGAAANSPMINSPMNKVQTMASTADDLVSYYSRALQGEFFKNKETLNEFRRILASSDAIWLLPLPLGVSAFVKGGSIDVVGFHAICAPGAMFFNDRWVYFCLAYNWYAKGETDGAGAGAFVAAGSRALTMIKDALST